MDLYKMRPTFIALLVVILFPCETFQFVVRRHHPYKRIPDVCQKVHCDTPPPSKYKNCHLFTEKNKQLKDTLGIYIDCCPVYQCNNVADGKNVLYIGTSLDQHANETKMPRTTPRQVIMSNLPRPVATTPTRRPVSTTTTTTTSSPVTTSTTPSPVTTTTTSTKPSPVTTTTTPSPVITTVITTTTTTPSPVTPFSTTTTSTPPSTTESDEDSPELETTTRSFRNFGRRLKIEETTTASSNSTTEIEEDSSGKTTTKNVQESTELPESTTESEYSEDYSPELETTTRHFRNFGRRLKIGEPETTTSKPPLKATPLFTPAMLQELKKQVHPVRLQMQTFNGNQKCTYLVTTKDGKKSCITIQDA